MARKEKAFFETENRAHWLPRQIAATPGTYRYLMIKAVLANKKSSSLQDRFSYTTN